MINSTHAAIILGYSSESRFLNATFVDFNDYHIII